MRAATRAWALALFLLVLFPVAARAATGNCTISGGDIVFGTFTGSEVDVNGSLTISCTGGSGNNTFNVRINPGTAPSTFTNRVLNNGANHLSYQLYTDSTRGHIFGDNSGGTSQIPVTANYPSGVTAMTFMVPFFAVLSTQAVPPFGTYTSTITVTLEAGGANGSGSFQVSAVVAPVCSVTANNLNFGTYTKAQLDGTTTLSATCTSGGVYSIGLNPGVSTGASVTNRAMTGPSAQLLHYGLFQDANRTVNWGNTPGTDTPPQSTGTGTAQTFTVYGRVPASQAVGPGLYQDTITVTLTF